MSDTERAVALTSGTVSVEPRIRHDRRQSTWSGPECPNEECGSTRTPVRTSGKDLEDRPLRERVCADCGQVFTTIEQVILFGTGLGPHGGQPVKFSLVDVEHRRRRRESKRRRFGWQAGGRMLITRQVRIFGVPRVNVRKP